MSTNKAYLRATEIAALTGVTVRTIRRWIADEILPSTKLGGARLVSTADLEVVLSSPRDEVQHVSDHGEGYDDETEA